MQVMAFPCEPLLCPEDSPPGAEVPPPSFAEQLHSIPANTSKARTDGQTELAFISFTHPSFHGPVHLLPSIIHKSHPHRPTGPRGRAARAAPCLLYTSQQRRRHPTGVYQPGHRDHVPNHLGPAVGVLLIVLHNVAQVAPQLIPALQIKPQLRHGGACLLYTSRCV